MKLVLFEDPSSAATGIRAGVMRDDRVIDVTAIAGGRRDQSPQHLIERIIDGFEHLRPGFEHAAGHLPGLPLDQVRLRAPLPRPSKIICCIGNYWEHAERQPRSVSVFLKSPDSVIGPGETLVLPKVQLSMFQHEAELAAVIRGPAREIAPENYRSAIFGYTCFIDGSGRGEGRMTWGMGGFQGKSFDTFAPIGPCITTADEISDPNRLAVKLWNDGQLRHDYTTDDMENKVPEVIRHVSSIMTLNSGDVIAFGTNHEGLGPMQDGEELVIAIEKIGMMQIRIADPLKRKWERGIYLGPGSTARAAAIDKK